MFGMLNLIDLPLDLPKGLIVTAFFHNHQNLLSKLSPYFLFCCLSVLEGIMQSGCTKNCWILDSSLSNEICNLQRMVDVRLIPSLSHLSSVLDGSKVRSFNKVGFH